MSFGSQFQTFGTAAHNTRLVVSVQVHAQRDGGASVDHRDRGSKSSSLYGGTEVDRVLVVMTAILYWMRCWTGSQWREYNNGLAWTHLRCWQITRTTLFWGLCSLSTTATGWLLHTNPGVTGRSKSIHHLAESSKTWRLSHRRCVVAAPWQYQSVVCTSLPSDYL